jgi:hypothetical protein
MMAGQPPDKPKRPSVYPAFIGRAKPKVRVEQKTATRLAEQERDMGYEGNTA